MAALDNPRCFLDIDIGGIPEGRISVELFADVVPRYACNALSLLLPEACVSQCSVSPWYCAAGQLRTSGACAQGKREWDNLAESCGSKEARFTASSLTSCARQVPLPARKPCCMLCCQWHYVVCVSCVVHVACSHHACGVIPGHLNWCSRQTLLSRPTDATVAVQGGDFERGAPACSPVPLCV